MRSFNRFFLWGRVNLVQTFDKVTMLSVATDRQSIDEQGRRNGAVDLVEVSLRDESLRKRASRDLNLGDEVVIEGNIESAYGGGHKELCNDCVATNFVLMKESGGLVAGKSFQAK
jgi:Single-strand binding protein family